MMSKSSEETNALFNTLCAVCDLAELPSHKELAAVSMLLAAVGFKYGITKETMLGSMSQVIDKTYKELSDE